MNKNLKFSLFHKKIESVWLLRKIQEMKSSKPKSLKSRTKRV